MTGRHPPSPPRVAGQTRGAVDNYVDCASSFVGKAQAKRGPSRKPWHDGHRTTPASRARFHDTISSRNYLPAVIIVTLRRAAAQVPITGIVTKLSGGVLMCRGLPPVRPELTARN
jgi:hypothetical protein